MWSKAGFSWKHLQSFAEVSSEWLGRHNLLADAGCLRLPFDHAKQVFKELSPVAEWARRSARRDRGILGRRYGAAAVQTSPQRSGRSPAVLIRIFGSLREEGLSWLRPDVVPRALAEFERDAKFDRLSRGRFAAAHGALQQEAHAAGFKDRNAYVWATENLFPRWDGRVPFTPEQFEKLLLIPFIERACAVMELPLPRFIRKDGLRQHDKLEYSEYIAKVWPYYRMEAMLKVTPLLDPAQVLECLPAIVKTIFSGSSEGCPYGPFAERFKPNNATEILQELKLYSKEGESLGTIEVVPSVQYGAGLKRVTSGDSPEVALLFPKQFHAQSGGVSLHSVRALVHELGHCVHLLGSLPAAIADGRPLEKKISSVAIAETFSTYFEMCLPEVVSMLLGRSATSSECCLDEIRSASCISIHQTLVAALKCVASLRILGSVKERNPLEFEAFLSDVADEVLPYFFKDAAGNVITPFFWPELFDWARTPPLQQRVDPYFLALLNAVQMLNSKDVNEAFTEDPTGRRAVSRFTPRGLNAVITGRQRYNLHSKTCQHSLLPRVFGLSPAETRRWDLTESRYAALDRNESCAERYYSRALNQGTLLPHVSVW